MESPHLTPHVECAVPQQQPGVVSFCRSHKVDLFLASFVALFLELTLIRWVPTYERVLAYFTNFILIAAFLGLGLGAILSNKGRRWLAWQPLLVLSFVALGFIFNQYGVTGSVLDDVYYTETTNTR